MWAYLIFFLSNISMGKWAKTHKNLLFLHKTLPKDCPNYRQSMGNCSPHWAIFCSSYHFFSLSVILKQYCLSPLTIFLTGSAGSR